MIIGIKPLPKFDSETITDATLKIMKNRGIQLQKVVGGTTDGASNILGKHSGVLTRLKDYCPFMIRNHCAAHRVN